MSDTNDTPNPTEPQDDFHRREWLRLAAQYAALADDARLSAARRNHARREARKCRRNAGESVA